MDSVFDVSGEELRGLDPAERKLDLAVIHLTFEGIQIFGGGVCTVTRGHLDALEKLKEKMTKN